MFTRASQVQRAVYYRMVAGQYAIVAEMMDGICHIMEICDTVGIAISEIDGRLLKHGAGDKVAAWARGQKDVAVAVFHKGLSVDRLNAALLDQRRARGLIERSLGRAVHLRGDKFAQVAMVF